MMQNPKRQSVSPTAAAQRARQAAQRAQQRARWQRAYHTVNALFNFNGPEFIGFLQTALKWLILGTLAGILAGTASAIFLISLAWATDVRLANPGLLLLLPAAGFVVGWIYWRFGGTAGKGNNLVIDEVNNNRSRIPLRMAPFVLLGTVATHFFGGSAGREGTAIQMGASLADGLRRLLRLNPIDRRLMLMAGIAGGFGSVFGVPTAGFIFGMEVQNVGRMRYEGIIPCLVASFVGDFVTRALGAAHSHYPKMAEMGVDPLLMAKVAVAGIAFGLTSMLFIELIHGIKHILQRLTQWPPLYPVIGGLLIIGLTLLVGTTDYLGLSLPLISNSVSGIGVATFAFLLKLLFTTITLGSGYYGGEVTPLLVIGSTLGFTLGGLLGVDPAFMASIGLVAVFAGASNTPLASAIMGVELVGGGATLYLFLGCTVAYLASGHRGIYATQQVAFAKSFGFAVKEGDNLLAVAERHNGWLPPLPGLSGTLAQRMVRGVMSNPAIMLRESTPLPEVVAVALREGVRALPVVNSQHVVVGIITDNDLKRAGIMGNLTLLSQLTPQEQAALLSKVTDQSAQDIMTAPAQSIAHTATLAAAIDLLNAADFKRLPVVDQTGHLMGIITRSDIIREIVVQDLPLPADSPDFNWQATASDVDLEQAHTVSEGDSIDAVVGLMLKHAAKRVVVIDEQRAAVGMITQNDLLSRTANGERQQLVGVLQGDLPLAEAHFSQAPAQVMTTPVICIQTDTLVYTALRLMLDNQIKRLPVINAQGQLMGMVGRAGLLRALLSSEGQTVRADFRAKP